MTSYNDIIDLALVSIEDYRLNKIANNYIDENNYDIVISSSSYEIYVSSCETNFISPIDEEEYNYIKSSDYDNYEEYVQSSMKSFYEIMDGFMIRGLPNFDICLKDLSNRNDIEREFNFILSDIEKDIIADYTVLSWLDKEINNTSQITAMLQNKNEAHRYSEANNLNAKVERSVKLKEDVSQKKTNYSLRNNNWKEWGNNNYGI